MNIVLRNTASSLSRALRAIARVERRRSRASALTTALAGAAAGCACGVILVAGAPRAGGLAAGAVVPVVGRSDVSPRPPEAEPRSVSAVLAPAVDAGARTAPDPERTLP